MFSIAVISSFRAGQTTTINAMAGKITCPSGDYGGGIRTSSCAVKVNYSTNQPTVIWKSKETLSRDLEYWTGGQVSLTEQSDSEIKDAFKELALNMTEQLKTCDMVVVDMMHQVLLYMSYYDHPQVVDWLRKDTFTTEEVFVFMTFPADLDCRWFKVHEQILRLEVPTPEQLRKIVRDEFYPTNAMYLFIETVTLSTQSRYMRKGLSVFDTPRFFGNMADDRATIRFITEADAIFYFFNGETTLTAGDRTALTSIDNLGCKKKVFFGINFRSPLDRGAVIRQTIQVQLQTLGYNAPHQQRLLLFNAFLAQRAGQGQLILDGELTQDEAEQILYEARCWIDSKEMTVEQAWLETTADVMRLVGLIDDEKIFINMGITEESINFVRRAGRLDNVINFILQTERGNAHAADEGRQLFLTSYPIGREKNFMPQTSQEQLEMLKQEFETELKGMKQVGEELARSHPRYKDQAKELINIADKKLAECNANMFSIALGADFQAGKSTTVNAISGHVICPSGNGGGGIRTSSCAVKVNYGATKPTVIWKSEETLSRDLGYWTGGQISLIEQSPAEINDAFKELALNMTEQLKTYDTVVVDRMHQILMYMSYYDHPKVTEWLSRDTFTSEEILHFLAFPADNDTRWLTVQNQIMQIEAPTPKQIRDIIWREFYPTNAMYLFIEMVNFATPSEYLRSLGITVVDTPGLKMTDNDTRVALSCMSDATSIFYFFNGERMLDETDRKALKLIDDLGFKSKVFFGINFKTPLAQGATIRQTIQVQLQTLGYNAPHQQRLLLFNAFLAQRARQGQLILDNALNRNDVDKILSEAEAIGIKTNDVKQAWIETTADVMHTVREFNDITEPQFRAMGITKESIDFVYKASRWDEVMNFILDYVLENRSRALLVERVAKPIGTQLTAIEQVLRRDEENAKQTADDLRQKYDVAIKSYKDFQSECSDMVAECIQQKRENKVTHEMQRAWDYAIASDCYENVFEQCSKKIAAEAVDKIQASQTFLNNMGFLATGAINKIRGFFSKDGAKMQSALERETASIMKAAAESVITQLATIWSATFEKSNVYRDTIQRPVESLHRDIIDKWNKRNMTDNDLLRGLLTQLQERLPTGTFSYDSKTIELPTDALSNILGRQLGIGNQAKETFQAIVGGIVGGSGVLAIYLFVLPADFIVPFAAEIIGVITIAIAALIKGFSSTSRQAREREKLKGDLTQAMDRVFRNECKREEIIRNLIEGGQTEDGKRNPGLKFYREFYNAAFEVAIKSCGDILAEQAKKAEEDARAGDEARQKIADEARQIRKGVIAGLQRAMNNLQRRVNALFPPAKV